MTNADIARRAERGFLPYYVGPRGGAYTFHPVTRRRVTIPLTAGQKAANVAAIKAGTITPNARTYR